MKKLWGHVLGLAAIGRAVDIDAVEFDPDVEEIVATVRPRRNARPRCGCVDGVARAMTGGAQRGRGSDEAPSGRPSLRER